MTMTALLCQRHCPRRQMQFQRQKQRTSQSLTSPQLPLFRALQFCLRAEMLLPSRRNAQYGINLHDDLLAHSEINIPRALLRHSILIDVAFITS